MDNPFNIGFGEQPLCMISRTNEFEEIKSLLTSETPSSRSLIIAGQRGCGKTVLLAVTKNYFNSLDDWITVDLNPFMNMHEQLASKLYEEGKMKHLFTKTEFNFSFHGLSFNITGGNPVSNVNSLLDIMFSYLKKKNIKVLITIDDIAKNDHVQAFIYSFQSFLREGYNVFLVMTGLYKNISELENVDNLTFLLRAPKLFLDNLNMREIFHSYSKIFNIDEQKALELAKTTKGYAYGYQLLGNILYKNNSTSLDDDTLHEYDMALEENVYSKIWSGLSQKEKEILYSMTNNNSISSLIKDTKLNNSALQVYKNRLSKQGLIDTSKRGEINFSLPRFKEFVQFRKLLES